MKTNQLPLFDETRSIRIDELVFQLQNMVSNYKYTALLTEQNLGKDSPMFIYMKSAAKVLAELLPTLSWESNKYRHYTKGMWEKLGTYDPYYCPVQPRSISRLHEIARDYDRSSTSLLLRFKGILDSLSETTIVIERFNAYKLKIDQSFKAQYHYEF
jgi:hypothetical protein